MGSIKDRNGMNLREAEDIKKRWQEYTEALYKKALHDSDNHDGMITFQPHGQQHASHHCPSLSPRVCSSSCTFSQ